MGWWQDLFGAGSRFRRETDAAIEVMGLDVRAATDRCVYFVVETKGGRAFKVYVTCVDGNVVISVHSDLVFPRGLPKEVCRRLDTMNRKMPHCDYDAYHGDEGSRFVVRTAGRLDDYDAGVLRDALRDMVPYISHLDEWLEDNGHVR